MTAHEIIEAAAKLCEKRAEVRTHEYCMQDPETGAWEGGPSWVNDANEEDDDCAAAIRALKATIKDGVIVPVEPVAWMRDAGEDSLSTMTACVTNRIKDIWLHANPKQVERYTIPLFAAARKDDDA